LVLVLGLGLGLVGDGEVAEVEMGFCISDVVAMVFQDWDWCVYGTFLWGELAQEVDFLVGWFMVEIAFLLETGVVSVVGHVLWLHVDCRCQLRGRSVKVEV
jgi:hypothetical protein